MIDLATVKSIGTPIAAELLPGWTVTWIVCSAEQMPIKGALAVCRAKQDATPTRSLVTVYVLADWPAGESLPETLWHELTHAVMSPFIALIPESAASVMLEEQTVERLGKLLAKIPMAARLAVISGMSDGPARIRARLLALAPRARIGGTMTPEQIKAAIESLKAGDGAAALVLLEQLLVTAATGEATAPSDAAPAEAPAAQMPAAAGAAPSMDPAKGRLMNDEKAYRARMSAAANELEAIRADALTAAKITIVDGLRARLPGHTGLPAVEKAILAEATYVGAKKVAEIAEAMGGGAARARSGAEVGSADLSDGADVAALTKEGFDAAWIGEYTLALKGYGKEHAAELLTRGRAGLQRARVRQQEQERARTGVSS